MSGVLGINQLAAARPATWTDAQVGRCFAVGSVEDGSLELIRGKGEAAA
jgi:hypothetical protein